MLSISNSAIKIDIQGSFKSMKKKNQTNIMKQINSVFWIGQEPSPVTLPHNSMLALNIG